MEGEQQRATAQVGKTVNGDGLNKSGVERKVATRKCLFRERLRS